MPLRSIRAIVDDNEFLRRADWKPMSEIPSRASDAGPVERQPFFSPAAEPCESCGDPCKERQWNPEYELWIGVDCSCSIPDGPPMPECYRAVLMAAETVGQMVDSIREHVRTCPTCGGRKPIEIPRPVQPSGEKAA